MPKKGYKQTKEHKGHLSEVHRGKPKLWQKGKKLPKKTKEKISNTMRGRKRPRGVREKISKAHMGKKLSKEWKEKISKSCKGQANFKGRNHSEKTKKRISKVLMGKYIGKKNPNWKGKNAGCQAMHSWIYKYRGKPKICEHCGKTTEETRLHWANKDHKYRRNLNDYISLCVACHKKYDLKMRI